MPLCQFGAQPKPPNLASTLVWYGLDILATGLLAELTRISPWIVGAITTQLISVGNLCDSNPEVPEPFTPADVLGFVVDPLVGPIWSEPFVSKVIAYIKYQAALNYCQCVGNPAGCQQQTFTVDYDRDLVFVPAGPGFVWPSNSHGTNNSAIAQFLPWVDGCYTVDVTIWHGAIGSPGQPQLVTQVVGCSGQLYHQSHIMGTPVAVTLPAGTCASGGTGLWLEWFWNVDPTLHKIWTVVINPHSGQTPIVEPPTPLPPPQTGPVPTPPALPCDAATQCAIIWNIVNRINVSIGRSTGIQTTVNTGLPTSYAIGNSYTVSGTGVQVVAQDILGVVVQFVAVPPNLIALQTDPPRYYDVGWIAFGAGDAVDGKRWLHSSGDRFIPVFPEVDRVHYNLGDQVVVTIVELVPPPTSS